MQTAMLCIAWRNALKSIVANNLRLVTGLSRCHFSSLFVSASIKYVHRTYLNIERILETKEPRPRCIRITAARTHLYSCDITLANATIRAIRWRFSTTNILAQMDSAMFRSCCSIFRTRSYFKKYDRENETLFGVVCRISKKKRTNAR